MVQPPISSSRSYTRPIQPPAAPRDFDPSNPPPHLRHQQTSQSQSQYRRPSSQLSTRSRDVVPPHSQPQDWDPRLSMRRTSTHSSSSPNDQRTAEQPDTEISMKPEEWSADEESMLQLYGLSSLSPRHWEQTNEGDPGLFGEPQQTTTGTTGSSSSTSTAKKGDELDPLGLIKGGVLA